jgi:hypothetical protein
MNSFGGELFDGSKKFSFRLYSFSTFLLVGEEGEIGIILALSCIKHLFIIFYIERK